MPRPNARVAPIVATAHPPVPRTHPSLTVPKQVSAPVNNRYLESEESSEDDEEEDEDEKARNSLRKSAKAITRCKELSFLAR